MTTGATMTKVCNKTPVSTKLKSSLYSLLFILFLLVPSILLAKSHIRTIEGIVTKVSDGDTIHVTDNLGTKVKVRLYGIDAPETDKPNKSGQPYGLESYQALNDKIYRKQVNLDVLDIDKYKRLVCIVYLNGKSINQEMVAEGYAWAYRKYLNTPYASEYIGLEDQARGRKLGLWQQNNPEPPWEFRKSLNSSRRARR